jgi:hypothetical protein
VPRQSPLRFRSQSWLPDDDRRRFPRGCSRSIPLAEKGMLIGVEIPENHDVDRSMSVREVPGWQIRPNDAMNRLTANWRGPEQTERA